MEKEKIKKVKTDIQELEVMNSLKETVYWQVLKRWMRRYIENLKSISFNMSYEESGENFKTKHRGYTAQASAFKTLVKAVEGSGKKIDKEGD